MKKAKVELDVAGAAGMAHQQIAMLRRLSCVGEGQRRFCDCSRSA